MTTTRPGVLARGPWRPEQVQASWRDDAFVVPSEVERLADGAVAGLRERGSPAHDGLATRLVGFEADGERLRLELQPVRWALRLLDDASDSLTALCVVRSEDGRWLAGRRAAWVSTWANRWALGAGGAVDLGESPADTLSRELYEEWKLEPADLSVEALLALPGGMNMLVGPRNRPGRLRARARRRARRMVLVARRHRALARRGGRAAQADGSPTGQLTPVPPMPQ